MDRSGDPGRRHVTLTYTWTLGEGTPPTVPISTSWTNEAGVVEYQRRRQPGRANDEFVYVPRNNIDPTREAGANTDPARDDAHLSSPGITMTKSRTTELTQPGNAGPNQATIGEAIHFTVEGRVRPPDNRPELCPHRRLDEHRHDLCRRHRRLSAGTVVNGSCTYPTDPIPPNTPPVNLLTVTGDVITLALPGSLSPTEDLCVQLRFDATVDDNALPTAHFNVRPGTVRNTAVLRSTPPPATTGG